MLFFEHNLLKPRVGGGGVSEKKKKKKRGKIENNLNELETSRIDCPNIILVKSTCFSFLWRLCENRNLSLAFIKGGVCSGKKGQNLK